MYKYRTIEQTKKILDNLSFWFATPESFNDPFDCNLSENKTQSLDDLKKHLRFLGKDESTIQKLISPIELDPKKIIELIETTKKHAMNSRGVLSLSKKYDNILMWSHYTKNHEGIVLGLNPEEDLDFFLTPVKIEYQDSYKGLDYLSNPEKSIQETLKTKSSYWSYEEEIRIYKTGARLRKINKSAIKKIYFGIKTKEESINEIQKITKEKGMDNIQYFKGEIKHGAFEINFLRIK